MSKSQTTPSRPFKTLISRERLIEKIMADPDDETITAGSNAMTPTIGSRPVYCPYRGGLKQVCETPDACAGGADCRRGVDPGISQPTSRPAFVPPDAKDPKSHCYICGGRLGVFMWTDRRGIAHTSCVPSEREKWGYENGPMVDVCDSQ